MWPSLPGERGGPGGCARDPDGGRTGTGMGSGMGAGTRVMDGDGDTPGDPAPPRHRPGGTARCFRFKLRFKFRFRSRPAGPSSKASSGPFPALPCPLPPPCPLPGPLPCPAPLGMRIPCRGSASPGSPALLLGSAARGLRASLLALCVFVKAQSSPGFGSCCDSRGAPKAQPEPRCPASWCSHGATGGLRAAAAAAVAGGPGFQALCKRVNGR